MQILHLTQLVDVHRVNAELQVFEAFRSHREERLAFCQRLVYFGDQIDEVG